MARAQGFALNFWTLTASKVLYRLVSVGVSVYLARALGAAVLGQYATVMNVLTLFLSFADLGVTNLVIRDVARDRARAAQYLDTFFALQLFTGLAVAALSLITGVASGYAAPLLAALAVGAAGPFFTGLSNAYEALLNAHERFHPFAVIETACMLVFLAGNLVVVLGGGGLVALVAVTSVTALARLVLGAWWAGRHGLRAHPRVSRAAVGGMLRSGLPFLLINGAHFAVQRLDVLFLSWIVADARTGVYAAASRLVFASQFPIAAVGALLYPVLSRMLGEHPDRARELYRRGSVLLFAGGAALALLFQAAAPVIVDLLYGAGYGDSVRVLQLLGWFLPVYAAGLLASNALMAGPSPWTAVRATLWSLGAMVAAQLAGIRVFEISGAAGGVLLAEAVASVLYIAGAARAMDFRIDAGSMGRIAVVAVLSGCAAAWLHGAGGAWAFAALPLFAALLWALRAVRAADLADLRSLLFPARGNA